MQKNPTDLLNLRNLMKRDPQGYLDEFQQQWRHYQSMHAMMKLKEHHNPHLIKEFASLVTFLSHVAPCYPTLTAHFPTELVALIAEHAHTIPPYLRLNLLQALILLQNRSMISRFAVLPLFFQLFCLHDKPLRKLLFSHIVQDIKRVNQNKKNVKLNNALQNFLFSMLQSDKKRSHGQGRVLGSSISASLPSGALGAGTGGAAAAAQSSAIISAANGISTASIASASAAAAAAAAAAASSSSAPGKAGVNVQTQAADEKEMAAKKSIDVMIDLWRRKVWTDEKTVHIISECCFSPYTKIMVSALRFFLGLSFYEDEDDSDDEDNPNAGFMSKNQLRKEVSAKQASLKGMIRKTKKREREIKRAMKKLKREDREGEAEAAGSAPGLQQRSHSSLQSQMTVPALQLLRDPHTFAERLFSRLRSSTDAFVVRMLMMNVLSRCVGTHQLLLLNLYPYLQKYLQPHQRHVTAILTFVAQAAHPLVPPDHMRPVLVHLATNFVSDRSSVEVMQVGINAVREICARCPLAMTRTLLLDLAAYKKHKNKGVMMASRSLIALYRDVFPHMLHRRERGKPGADKWAATGGSIREAKEVEDDDYALFEVNSDVLGAELLAQYEREQKEKAAARARGEHVPDSDEEEGEEGDEEEEVEVDEEAWNKMMQEDDDDEEGGEEEDDEEEDDEEEDGEDDEEGEVEEEEGEDARDEEDGAKDGAKANAPKKTLKVLRKSKGKRKVSAEEKREARDAAAAKRRERSRRRAEDGDDAAEEDEEDEPINLRSLGRKITLSEVDDYLKELQSSSDEEGEDGEEDAVDEAINDGDDDAAEEGEDADEQEDDEEDDDGEEAEDDEDDEEAEEEDDEEAEEETSAASTAKRPIARAKPKTAAASSSTASETSSRSSAPPGALPYAATKIFTAEDFELLRKLRLKQVMSTTGSRVARKRSATAAGLDAEDAEQRSAEILALREGSAGLVGKEVDVTTIESMQKKKRRTREERLEAIKANREEGNNGNNTSRARKAGGTSNVEKLKTKAFMMVRAKSLKKHRGDKFSARQARQQKHIHDLKNMSSHLKKKVLRAKRR